VHGDGDHRKLIYILATAWHEAKLRPVKERRANKDRQPGLYELQSKYWPSGYYGRGYVQLTWESNYQKMGDFIGADLVSTPDLALQPRYAAEIIVYGMMNGSFTGRKLGSYITLLSADYRNARRVVNATDQAGLIRDYALQLQAEFQKA
jgi:putative chitinase